MHLVQNNVAFWNRQLLLSLFVSQGQAIDNCINNAFCRSFFCDISVILLFKLIGCLRQIGFCEVIKSVIFVSPFKRRKFVSDFDISVLGLKVCDTSYSFPFRLQQNHVSYNYSHTTTKRSWCQQEKSKDWAKDCHLLLVFLQGLLMNVPYNTGLYCFWQSQQTREASYTQSFRCLMKRAPQDKYWM